VQKVFASEKCVVIIGIIFIIICEGLTVLVVKKSCTSSISAATVGFAFIDERYGSVGSSV
jgi:hypothetical protein